jgi:hypothetical protein
MADTQTPTLPDFPGWRFVAVHHIDACDDCTRWARKGAPAVAYYTAADCAREAFRTSVWREARATMDDGRRVSVRLDAAPAGVNGSTVCGVCHRVMARAGRVSVARWVCELATGDVAGVNGEEHAVRLIDGPDLHLDNGRRVSIAECSFVRRGARVVWSSYGVAR